MYPVYLINFSLTHIRRASNQVRYCSHSGWVSASFVIIIISSVPAEVQRFIKIVVQIWFEFNSSKFLRLWIKL